MRLEHEPRRARRPSGIEENEEKPAPGHIGYTVIMVNKSQLYVLVSKMILELEFVKDPNMEVAGK